MKNWLNRKHHERAARALERQLEFQQQKAQSAKGSEAVYLKAMFESAQKVRNLLEEIRPISETDKILEVGSGAHGIVFGFGSGFKIGIDPLAAHYKKLFPLWQKYAQTVAAIGEKLPFADAAFDIVISDNVVDHAENPEIIIKELARVLKPDGLLYFSVNVHHPIYQMASNAHGFWNALGFRYEISPFADHTVHYTQNKVQEIFKQLPFRVVKEISSVSETRKTARAMKAQNMEDRFKKLFFKNALFEIVAIRK